MSGRSEKDWVSVPSVIPLCPPGLEFLATMDQLLVHQEVEWIEVFLGFETKNRYTIKNISGQTIYTAKEDTDCCTRFCCGTLRPFSIIIKDLAERDIIHLYREYRCDSCWCPCCLQKLEIFAPPGSLIGVVEQDWTICKPKFSLKDASGNIILKIKGPFCTYSVCGDVEFKVLSMDGVQLGKISKQWSGLLKEAFTDADNYSVSFPLDLNVEGFYVLRKNCKYRGR